MWWWEMRAEEWALPGLSDLAALCSSGTGTVESGKSTTDPPLGSVGTADDTDWGVVKQPV